MDSSKVRISVDSNGERRVIANETIYRNEGIARFDGQVFSWENGDVPNEAPDYVRDHAIQFHPFRCREAKGIARLINHSCEPNCGVRDLFRIVAMRLIVPGEEITWDYEMAEDDDWEMRCSCGSASCRVFIRGYRFLPLSKRIEYGEYLSKWHIDPYVGEIALQEKVNDDCQRKLENFI